VLRKKEARMPTNWSRRFKNHSESCARAISIKSPRWCETFRFATRTRVCPRAEKRIARTRARQILVSELTFALNVDTEAAEEKLASVLP